MKHLKRIRWTQNEICTLKALWDKGRKTDEILESLGNRSWEAIRRKAYEIGLECDGKINKRANRVDKLLDMSPESLYWIGFILGDGHLSKQGYICLAIHNKDRDHLIKFADYIEIDHSRIRETRNNMIEIRTMNKNVVNTLQGLFCMGSNKTKSGITIPSDMCSEMVRLLGYGLIDADGTIGYQTGRSDNYISLLGSIECKMFIEKILSCLVMLDPDSTRYEVKTVRMKNYNGDLSDYAQIRIARNSLIKAMKIESIKLGIPTMERKWGRIK